MKSTGQVENDSLGAAAEEERDDEGYVHALLTIYQTSVENSFS